jgi:GT2 family glycosyltransferase
MTDAPSLSVVIASHGRPRALRRCLIALSQSSLDALEAVVVADSEGLEAVAQLPFADRIKTVLQAEANISQARNDGIARAAGEVVAFLDDDAVPEPTWAAAIVSAFAASAGLSAVTGPVLGRNGISLQWGPVVVDRRGRDIPVEAGTMPPQGTVLKLHGTNMAVRRAALELVGGFDPAFRYFLDDTDLARRLAAEGMGAQWLDRAQVHHAFAASERRTADRVPLSLHDIGASTAVFLRKHAPDEMDNALRRLVDDQRIRLFRFVRRRKLGARDVERLMHSLRDGIDDGLGRTSGEVGTLHRGQAFLTLTATPPQRDVVICGWRLHAARLRTDAEDFTSDGARVTLFLFEPTPRAHKVAFVDGGWWEQTGGLYGRSDRKAPRIQPWRARSRLFDEFRRIAATRFVDDPDVQFRIR